MDSLWARNLFSHRAAYHHEHTHALPSSTNNSVYEYSLEYLTETAQLNCICVKECTRSTLESCNAGDTRQRDFGLASFVVQQSGQSLFGVRCVRFVSYVIAALST